MRKTPALLIAAALAASLAHAEPNSVDTNPEVAGAAVFQRWCAACHSAGDNYAGTVALRAKYGGQLPAVLTERTDLTPDMVKYFVRHGVSIMPFFRKTEISDQDLAALAVYLLEAKKPSGSYPKGSGH